MNSRAVASTQALCAWNYIAMNEATEHEITWEPFVGRGVLGGMMGMFIVAMVAVAFVLTGTINFNRT